MALLKVVRQTLAGESTSFQFDIKGHQFLVKNLSSEDCLVNYEPINSGNEGNSIKILAGSAQLVFDREWNPHDTDTLYIKGTGEIEVQVVAW